MIPRIASINEAFPQLIRAFFDAFSDLPRVSRVRQGKTAQFRDHIQMQLAILRLHENDGFRQMQGQHHLITFFNMILSIATKARFAVWGVEPCG